ncbi:hypothetical protein BHM03_00051159 [Ensete ventricosum]|nr:hypothetical protein BHM03_00051159 [Ensete ventricosum]
MIEPIEESEEDDLESEEENMKEDQQPVDCMTHTLADHVNPQAMKVEESLKQQSVTILIKTMRPDDLINGKVKYVTLHGKRGSEEKTQRFEKYATSTEPSRFHPTRLHNFCMLILQEDHQYIFGSISVHILRGPKLKGLSMRCRRHRSFGRDLPLQ